MVAIADETRELRRRLSDKYGADVDLIALAAIGVTRHAWRSDWGGHIEDAHTRRRTGITDGEMFAANVATTRLVLGHFRSYPNVDWGSLADALTDANRVAGRRTLVDLLGKTRHARWTTSAWRYIGGVKWTVEKYGPEYALLLQANEGTCYDNWWAGPKWPSLVDAFVDQLAEKPPGMTIGELRTGLLEAPDRIDPKVLDWCASDKLIGYTLTRTGMDESAL